MITGQGGVGKSRLASQLCWELRGKGWHAGFFSYGQDITPLNDWEPRQPTFLVVDYNFVQMIEFGIQIANLYEPKLSDSSVPGNAK